MQSTPSKRMRAQAIDEDTLVDDFADTNGVGTPSKRKTRGLIAPAEPSTPRTNGVHTPRKTIVEGTPKSKRKLNFDTPSKVRFAEPDIEDETPRRTTRIADSSAKKKAAARQIKKSIAATGSEDDLSDEEDELSREILGEDEDEEEGEREENDGLGTGPEAETPVKRSRGRPKGSKNVRAETPPLADLPVHEQYFWQNRPGSGKTSNNTLSSHLLLNHDEYFAHREAYVDPHQQERDFLFSLHESAFPQWEFELRNGFNICLYGYGSKRALVQSFAEHINDSADKPPKIVIINGYNTSLTLRDILTTIASTLFPKTVKLPLQPSALHQLILETLADKPPTLPIYVLINSLDASPLRRPAIQTSLAPLAAHPKICLIATADTPNFLLMWDISLRQQYRFVFHDCTTFTPFDGAEIDVVESVNELLGRSGRRVGGRDGLGYVLKSLPENARNLYRILVAEQLAASIDGEELGADPDDGLEDEGVGSLGTRKENAEAGVEYRVLYHKAREELVCSTEHQFRGLLKEFYDHQMVESRRDGLGTERLVVPFRREDLEGLLEELVE